MGEVGRLVGDRYRVDRELEPGQGTQSLLVTDLRNGRPCVLRQLFVAVASPAAARRFDAQAAILAKLDHAGLPRFIDGFSEGDGAAAVRVVVTSYHPGESLERLLAKGRPLTEAQALVLLRRIVPVLVYLHAFEPPLVHRTIGATGIILGPDGRPCLTDLDYAVAGQAAPSADQAPPGPDELGRAAPEVFMGGAVPASDIYALGLAVCRGMTAREPASLLREGARVQLRGALGVSEAFAAVLARMLEPALERRYPDAKALEADLARLAGVRGVAAPPAAPQKQAGQAGQITEEPRGRRSARPLILAGVGLALVALALLAVLLRNPSPPGAPLQIAPAVREQSAAPSSPAAEPAAVPATATPADTPAPSSPGPGLVDQPAAPAVAPAPALAPASSTAVEPAPPSSRQAAPAVSALPAAPVVVQPPSQPAAVPAPSVDAGPAVAEGRLLFDGKPFANPAAPAPLFWFRNETTKAEVKPQVESAASAFAIRGLSPGRYAMSVRINLEPANPNIFPGDLTAWVEFAVEAGRAAALEVPLRTVMHLVQPVDNGVVIRGWDAPCGAGNVSPGNIVFSWDALAPGTRYDLSVDRLLCGRTYAPAGRVFTRSTTESWVKIDLPPSQEGECYSFRLTASREGRMVGIMATHGKSGLGWDYRFTVAR